MDPTPPPPPEQRRETLEWKEALPKTVHSMWADICKAMSAGSFTLVPHGTRTLVNRVARDLTGAEVNFTQSVELLEREGVISRREAERLMVVIEAGNAAAHRELDLTEDQARVLVHIVENLLRSAYLPQAAVDAVKTVIPPRSEAGRR
jgi:hypothetical protein